MRVIASTFFEVARGSQKSGALRSIRQRERAAFQIVFRQKKISRVVVRVLIAMLPAVGLAGCVTAARVPNSPFLTAVAGLASDPATTLASASPRVMNAQAAMTDQITTAAIVTPDAADAADAASLDTLALRGTVRSVTSGAAKPDADRKAVYPQIAGASSSMVGLFAAARIPAPPSGDGNATSTALRSQGKTVSLRDAVSAAVLSHPLMGAQAARVTGSLADVRTAQGATKPQLQVFAGSGGSYLGSYANAPDLFGSIAIPGSSRSDAGFTLRQLVYDFGAAKADITRSKSVVSAERLRLADQAEDIALRTVNAYLNLLEQNELIAMIDKVVVDENNFANLVKLNENQGNGTAADVNRIRSKVIEVEALRTDISTAYKTAQDEFFRLTKLESNPTRRPTTILSEVPPSLEVALRTAQQQNPLLLALNAVGTSLDQQLASQRAQGLPRIDLQGDGLVKHYVGTTPASQGVVDSRLMVMVSYKLLDGGIVAAQSDRIREDRKANDFRALDERESIELNLRRFYQSLSANRTKETAAIQGTGTANRANTLYLEQFKAGKRTVFEVLDSRMVVFTMQKTVINSRYEQLRAGYGILRNMGRLVETAIRN
jgi:adhesin transport system outer membrane protein